MKPYTFTFAAELTATIEAPSREEALRILRRRCDRADLWARFDEAAAMRGEPAKGVQDVGVRVIGRLA